MWHQRVFHVFILETRLDIKLFKNIDPSFIPAHPQSCIANICIKANVPLVTPKGGECPHTHINAAHNKHHPETVKSDP